MKWTSLNELREKYLSFFESKGHLRLPSFSLIPNNDKSLLLINSGMAPMKKFFTGEEVPPRNRVCTCQKCIRTPDLERVGHTARHGTYFEMLGNFSFGDYFKNEAIPWAWEFLTVTLEIPSDLLWPSVYEHDDEAYALWRDVIGVPEAHIVKLGKADNFWEHGSGPCGPCSEIYFDRGEKYGCGSPDCKPGCDCDRFMEIWNNVFSQFNNDGNGNYTELAQKNIDTGMGLERLACVMQGVDNLFEVDTVRNILNTVCTIAGKTYGADKSDDISIRVVTDHIRSATFMICDGVIPSNEGRGYVLRRILRRACRHGKLLGINRKFMTELCRVVISQNESAYPELVEKSEYILKVISLEEDRFNVTVDSGLAILAGIVEKVKGEGKSVISGDDAFKLYDTFGFPIDLTREIAEESGLSINEDEFAALMQEQKTRAREARGNISGWSDSSKSLLENIPATEFVGYESDACRAKVLAIIVDSESAEQVSEGECTIVFDKTVFYGEGGGQVGDSGVICGKCALTVTDTKKTNGIYLHEARVESGIVKVGDELNLEIDTERRNAIRRNHSACHLLQAALRSVLGTHVEQAGSYVDEHRVRFDFSHLCAMSAEEIAKVEAIVNANILSAQECSTTVTDIASARAMGAMALFGEKYGDLVRVVKIGPSSTELCGGTHVSSTGNIGLFKIISETGVAAGVRRIEGTTGLGVLDLLAERDALITETARELKVQNTHAIATKASSLQGQLRDMKRELDSANSKLSELKTASLMDSVKTVGNYKLLAARLDDVRPDAARGLCDTFKAKYTDGVVVFAIVSDGKLNFVAAAGSDAVGAGAHAGNILKDISVICGGKGGGRPDSAMSGGKDIDKIPEALARVEELLK